MIFLIHRVCEEFGVLPATAVRAIENDNGLIGEVLDVRAFVSAWRAYEDYERLGSEKATLPPLPKAIRERVLKARVQRLLDLKAQREGGGHERR